MSNKTCVYYGDYMIDDIYNLNDMFSNDHVDFFRLHQRINTNDSNSRQLKERYVVLTDIYFLLFDPVPHSKNLGKLLFWGDIRQIKVDLSDTLLLESETYELIWKDSEQINIELFFIRIHIREFLEKTQRKVKALNDKFIAFQDDFCKPEEYQRSCMDLDSLSALIRYKERLLKMYPSTSLSKDLIVLYQKIIEMYSSEDNSNYCHYVSKLQNIMGNKTFQQEIEREKPIKDEFLLLGNSVTGFRKSKSVFNSSD